MEQCHNEYLKLRFTILPECIKRLNSRIKDEIQLLDDIYETKTQNKPIKSRKKAVNLIDQSTIETQNEMLVKLIQKIETLTARLFSEKPLNIFHPQYEDSTVNMISPLANNTYDISDKIAVHHNHILPPPYNNAHIYGACLLQSGKYVGLCMGGQLPFVVYDLANKKIVKEHLVEKSGVFDALELDNGGILLGCNRTIKIIDKKNVDFNQGPCTPSRLLVYKNYIFGTDFLTQLGMDGSYCCQWKFNEPDVICYPMEGKSTGALVVINGKLIASDLNKRIYVWSIGNLAPIKVIKADEIITSLVQTNNNFMGAGRTKFYLWDLSPKNSSLCVLNYEFKHLNALSFLKHNENYIVGDNSGCITYFQCSK